MPYTLYSSPGACSMAVHVALHEVGVPFTYTPTSIGAGDTKTAAFLKLNPRGQVPVLVNEQGNVLLEGAAQMVYVLDTYGDGSLLPKTGWARATALQNIMFGNATLHGAYSKWFWCMKQQATPELQAKAAEAIQTLWNQIEAQLVTSGGPYMEGSTCRMGDILLGVIADWSTAFTFGPHTQAPAQALKLRAPQKMLPTNKRRKLTRNLIHIKKVLLALFL
jgi:glutathione S-transferase